MINIDNLASAWKGHRQFAHKAMRTVEPKITVDLGVDYGFSLFCFAECKIGKVYGIDIFDLDLNAEYVRKHGLHADAYNIVMDTIQKNSYDNVEVIKGYFDDVVETWNEQIDILHIDGLHTYEAVSNDFRKWSPFLKENGLLIMHDTVSYPGVFQLYNEIPWYKFNFDHSAGLGVLSKNEELIDRLKK